MTDRALPGVGLKGFWAFGETGWNGDMDTNLLAASVLMQLCVASATVALPGSPSDGYIAIVPSGGNINKIAVRDNGVWVYYTPMTGWRAHVADSATILVWNGTAWVDLTALLKFTAPVTLALGPHGTAARLEIQVGDVDLTSGTFVQTSSPVGAPDRSLLLGYTLRVLTTVTGTASLVTGISSGTWNNDYGTGIALTAGATKFCHTFSPISYDWGGVALPGVGVANAGTDAFTAGKVRIATYCLVIDMPDSVP